MSVFLAVDVSYDNFQSGRVDDVSAVPSHKIDFPPEPLNSRVHTYYTQRTRHTGMEARARFKAVVIVVVDIVHVPI